jgi:hypothetical protein
VAVVVAVMHARHQAQRAAVLGTTRQAQQSARYRRKDSTVGRCLQVPLRVPVAAVRARSVLQVQEQLEVPVGLD